MRLSWTWWICLFVATVCVIGLLLLLLQSRIVYETMTDECTTGCKEVESVLYTGYDQSFTHNVNNKSDSTDIDVFCKLINGGFASIDASQNYVLDTEKKTFLCKDPRHPKQTIAAMDDPLKVTSKYNTSKVFQKSDATNILLECSDYCKIYNGNSNMKDPNFTIDESNILHCKSQFDPDKILMPSVDTPNAKWAVDTSVEKKNLQEVETYCQTLRGGVDRNSTDTPMYTFSTTDKDILFNCTSYWTGQPIQSADIEKAVYTDKTRYPDAQTSFETLKDINNFCLPNKYEIIKDPTTNQYSFQCI
jgi:hypothetical protein